MTTRITTPFTAADVVSGIDLSGGRAVVTGGHPGARRCASIVDYWCPWGTDMGRPVIGR
jgi:hypothetical protein